MIFDLTIVASENLLQRWAPTAVIISTSNCSHCEAWL
uniref:Uncharacterized protein n=1 Tax=Arundo donax TaxID=35708 RepID=A0A0A9GWG9_ARUDO